MICYLSEKVENSTIEERVSFLEAQVADLNEDMGFVFHQQITQDERLLSVDQTSDQVVVELAEVNANIQGKKRARGMFNLC